MLTTEWVQNFVLQFSVLISAYICGEYIKYWDDAYDEIFVETCRNRCPPRVYTGTNSVPYLY